MAASVADASESAQNGRDEVTQSHCQDQDQNFTSSAMKLRELATLWEQAQKTGFANRFMDETSWYQSEHELPRSGEMVATVYEDSLLVGHRGSNEMYIFNSLTCRLIKTVKHPVATSSFDGITVRSGQIYANVVDEEKHELQLYTYDITEDTWNLLCTASARELYQSEMAVVDDRIFIVGGRLAIPPYSRVATVCCYSLSTSEWLSLPPMPTARANAHAVAVNGCLYVGGGTTVGGLQNLSDGHCGDVDVLALDRSQWLSFPPTTMSSCNLTGGNLGSIIASGGVRPDGHTVRIQSHMEVWDSRSYKWIPLPPVPRPRLFHGACTGYDTNPQMFLVGGYSMASTLDLSWSVPWLDMVQIPI